MASRFSCHSARPQKKSESMAMNGAASSCAVLDVGIDAAADGNDGDEAAAAEEEEEVEEDEEEEEEEEEEDDDDDDEVEVEVVEPWSMKAWSAILYRTCSSPAVPSSFSMR